jgi:PPK2 family polyphosphate:nucleotide phosphotransferase
MKLPRQAIDELRVRPGAPAELGHRSTRSITTDWLRPAGIDHPKDVAEQDLATFRSDLAAAQELLAANGTWTLLVILQALDAAGKDGTIAHVMSGVNPQGCTVTSFKQPSAEELDHDFLWRCAKALPPRGHIGIFNRSYYEEVLIVRVHPELLAAEHLPMQAPPDDPGKLQLWRHRFEDINGFERHLTRNGTRVVKFFLHVSKDVQRQRFLERLDDPAKHWKFSSDDVHERAFFDAYQSAYEEMLSVTSTEWAPWYVIPADHKYAMRALVGGVLVHEIDELGLRLPQPSAAELAALAAAREALLAEQ